jgi:xylulokinase
MRAFDEQRDVLLLGVDIGTTGTKAVLFDPNGRLESTGQAEYEVQHIRPAWVEQRPDDWWQAVGVAVRQALEGVADGAERVASLSVSSQAPALLPLDRSGKPLRPALIWMDRRAEAEATYLAERIGFENISRVTGNRPDAFYVAAKLLWYKNHEPELLARTARFVQINSYINYRLTGALAMDPAHAGLLQLRDYATNEWSPALCDACGVEPDQFPEVAASDHVIGEVTREAAAATGLRPGVPVVAGTVDSAAAALEAGVVQQGVAAEMTGTSTVMIMPNTTGAREPAFIVMPHALPALDLHLAAMVSSGASLRWFRQQFGLAEPYDGNPYEHLTREASAVPAGSDGVVFLPYMMGERSPLWHTNARGVFFGLSLATPRAAMVRSILEGTAYALLHNKEVAARGGIQITELRSVGGGARSDLWNQIKADVMGIPIALPEASAGAPFGDALLAGMGIGLYPDPIETVQKMVRIRKRYEPVDERHRRYSQSYKVYRRIYEHLRKDFDFAARVAAAGMD